MKHYLIFAALGPLLGGFLALMVLSYSSGYWTQTNFGEVKQLFVVFAKSVQYGYLFGLLPVLMIAAVDDILAHVRRISWVVRMVLIGVLGFFAAELYFGSRAWDSGAVQFILYGLVGLVPAMLSSYLSHKYAEPKPTPAATA